MKDKYNVFSERYSKILDLVEIVDESLVKDYMRFIDSIPEVVLDKLSKRKQFVCDGKDFRAILDKYDDQLCFEHITYDKYLCTSISIQPFYEEEIQDSVNGKVMEVDEGEGLFLFSLSFINTEDEPSIKLYYEQKENDINFVDVKVNGVEINTEVFIKREKGEFYLISKQTFIEDELQLYEKKVPVKYSELIDCIDYEEENEYADDI